MKKRTLIFLLIAVMALGSVLAGCGGGKQELVYPDYPQASTDTESWEQWEDYDPTHITIDWYVDYSTFNWVGAESSIVSDMIEEKTGIKINFMKPVTDDGTMLNTLIAGGKLPDVITVLANGAERVQLADEGYIYPINELSKRWAPNFMGRIDAEISRYFNASDGQLYGMPSHFYTTKDNESYEAQGHELLSNGAIVARKDYLEAYIAYKKAQDASWSDVQATTPEGFVEMCKWVKSNYGLSNTNPTVCLAPFETTNTLTGNKAINWLMEYFNVMPEDSQGNLTYQYEDERFLEMMLFLNDLYSENLIISNNFTTSTSQVGSYIQNGLPFVCVLSPQDYAGNFKEWSLKNPSAEYVPILLTNKDGEVPQLRSLAGNGYRFSMITANCKRPDRVIKLFDYLWSEEGQRLLYYGVEGVTYTYTEADETYPYGKMEWTQEVKDAFNNNTHGAYGMLNSFVMLTNPMFVNLTQEQGYPFNNYTSYVNYNLKAALSEYVYNHQILEFPLNTTDEQYGDMITLRSRLYQLWIEYIPKIVMAKDQAASEAMYREGLDYADKYGYKSLTNWMNEAYLKYKSDLGVQFGYPVNDASSGYKDLKITSIFGDASKYVSVPDDIVKQ